MEKFTFFWQKFSPFSHWYKSNFTIDNIDFNCGEQAMMYYKSILFNDSVIADEVLKETDPSQHKKLGREVKNFNSVIWDKHKLDIVYKINKAKFSQNPKLLKALLDTKGTTLAEASPYDIVWGIGYEKDHPNAKDRTKWRGQNLLGEILTKVRNDLEATK
jgi:ribA/ribD-fused uncharacterized protein